MVRQDTLLACQQLESSSNQEFAAENAPKELTACPIKKVKA